MNQKIMMVDNFYEYPNGYHESLKNSKCLINEEFIDKIQFLLDSKIKILSSSNEKIVDNKFNVESDVQSDLTCVVYLTYPPNCVNERGIRFFSHKKTKLDIFPDNSSVDVHGWNSFDDIKNSINFGDDSEWNEYANFFMRYNRAILFKSNLWHFYGNGFGKEFNDCMLFQKIKMVYD